MDITDLLGGVSLGADTSGNVMISFYGLAVKTPDGTFLAYQRGEDPDGKDDRLLEVDGMTFDGMSDFIFKIPVRAKNIKRGDLILASDSDSHPIYYFARGKVDEYGNLRVFDVQNGTSTTYVQSANLFNFQFYTKYVNLLPIEGFGGKEGGIDENLILLLALSKGSNNSLASILLLEALGGDDDEGGPMARMGHRRRRRHAFGNRGIFPFLLLAGQEGDKSKIVEAMYLLEASEEGEEAEEAAEEAEEAEEAAEEARDAAEAARDAAEAARDAAEAAVEDAAEEAARERQARGQRQQRQQ